MYKHTRIYTLLRGGKSILILVTCCQYGWLGVTPAALQGTWPDPWAHAVRVLINRTGLPHFPQWGS